MADFRTEIFELVNNNEYSFYKLYIDDVSHFDEFCQKIESFHREKKSLESIIALMDMFSASLMLPEKKFRQIKGIKRQDVFEFKKDNVRVYVIKDDANKEFYVVMGGLKNEQDADLKKLQVRIKGFNE